MHISGGQIIAFLLWIFSEKTVGFFVWFSLDGKSWMASPFFFNKRVLSSYEIKFPEQLYENSLNVCGGFFFVKVKDKYIY